MSHFADQKLLAELENVSAEDLKQMVLDLTRERDHYKSIAKSEDQYIRNHTEPKI